MSRRFQNQVYKGTLEDKGGKVYFVVDSQTDNSEKMVQQKGLTHLKVKPL